MELLTKVLGLEDAMQRGLIFNRTLSPWTCGASPDERGSQRPGLAWPCLFLQPSVSCTFSYSPSAAPVCSYPLWFAIVHQATAASERGPEQLILAMVYSHPHPPHHHQCFVGLVLLPSCPCVLQSWDPKGSETLGHSLPLLKPWPALCWPGLACVCVACLSLKPATGV